MCKINIKNIAMIIIGSIIGLTSFVFGKQFTIALILSLLLLFIIYVKKWIPKALKNKDLFILLIYGLLTRISLTLFDFFVQLPENGSDAQAFSNIAIEILSNNFQVITELSRGGAVAYYGYFIAIIYLLIGISFWGAILSNVVISLFFSYNIFRITKELFNENAAKIAFALTLFIPSFIFYSTALLRDIIIIFCISQILYLTIIYFKKNKVNMLIFTIPFFIILYLFRIEQFIITLLPFIFAIVYKKFKYKKVLFIGCMIIIMTIMFTPFFSAFMDKLDWVHEKRATGRTVYLQDADFDTPLNFAINFPIGAFYHLYSPLPHQVTNLTKDSIAFFESMFFLAISILLLVNIKTIKKLIKPSTKNAVILLLAYFALHMFIYAIGDTNVGTSYRHRIQVTFIILIFASPVINRYITLFKKHRKTKKEKDEIQNKTQSPSHNN